jgi:hypothetical protein
MGPPAQAASARASARISSQHATRTRIASLVCNGRQERGAWGGGRRGVGRRARRDLDGAVGVDRAARHHSFDDDAAPALGQPLVLQHHAHTTLALNLRAPGRDRGRGLLLEALLEEAHSVGRLLQLLPQLLVLVLQPVVVHLERRDLLHPAATGQRLVATPVRASLHVSNSSSPPPASLAGGARLLCWHTARAQRRALTVRACLQRLG